MSLLVPALKTLRHIRWATDEQHRLARRLISGKDKLEQYEDVNKWVAQCYHKPPYLDRLLCALNQVYETYGVEVINKGDFWDSPIVAEYLNTGDTYETTLVYRHDLGRFQVTTWGDLVEMFDRQNRS